MRQSDSPETDGNRGSALAAFLPDKALRDMRCLRYTELLERDSLIWFPITIDKFDEILDELDWINHGDVSKPYSRGDM